MMRKKFRVCNAVAVFSLSMSPTLFAQTTVEKIDTAVIDKIKEEGLQRSKVMESISFLTDVHGPRLTGSPLTKIAGEWTKNKLSEWGLENAHLESWGPFGRGWTLESCSVNLVEPHYTALIAHPKAWTPSTSKTIRSEPIYFDASTPEELEKYRGKLGRAIVLMSPPREIKPLFDPPATRQTDAELLKLANADVASSRRRGAGGPGAGGPPGSGGPGRPGRNAPPASPGESAQPPAADASATPGPRTEGRGAFQIQADKWQMAYEEGAAVVIEPGRGDGGTVFVQSATMPRRADPASRAPGAERANPFSSGPRPWATNPPDVMPQLVMAAEHYNRIVRMLQKGSHPKLSIDIESQYHDGDLNSFNVVAEIPGTDLKDEVVMLGGHFDSWHAGTGATDNAIGCGVALEAVRILKAIGAKPRRTIRIALWTGEEQGLLGSQAYVTDHFGRLKMPTRSGDSGDAPRERPRATYELKAEHEKFSAYFNLDNGTGKIRGIYLQGNEAVRPIFRAWLAPFADMGATTITSSNTGGTDHQSFDGIGLPGFQFIQDPLEYDTRTHHSSMDVYERIQADDAKQASIIMAAFVYQAAIRDEKLPRKALEGEVVTAPATSAPPVDSPKVPVPAAQIPE